MPVRSAFLLVSRNQVRAPVVAAGAKITSPAKLECSAAVWERTTVTPETLDRWSAGLNIAALSALHRLTAGLASQRTSEPAKTMVRHFAECAPALFKQDSPASIHTITDGRDAQPVAFNRHGDKRQGIVALAPSRAWCHAASRILRSDRGKLPHRLTWAVDDGNCLKSGRVISSRCVEAGSIVLPRNRPQQELG